MPPLNHIRILTFALLVAIASTAQSAGEDAFSGCPYSTQHAAAAAILNSMNPPSIRTNREYGGYLFHIPSKGYCFTEPVIGNHGNVNYTSRAKDVPSEAIITATWHTHGATVEGVISEIFSPQDMKLNQQQRLDGYLATPSGAFKYLPLDSRTTQLLGAVATE